MGFNIKSRVPKEMDRRRKLTEEQREEIKSLHAQGASYYSLGKKFGVSDVAIRNVIYPIPKDYISERNKRYNKNITSEKRREYYLRWKENKHKLIKEERALWE
jgi:DNA invertase Pin-like site-specific DNA recombinase